MTKLMTTKENVIDVKTKYMAKNGSKKTELSIEEIVNLKYLGVPELARYIIKSPGAIRNLVLRRGIPFHKPGGRLLFDREEIDQWIKQS